MRRTISFLFYVLSLSLLAQPQSHFTPSFEHIDVEAGLSNYNVGNISQDSLGYLWVGTSRGLNRYDGQVFKNYLFDPNSPEQGLPHDMIINVLCAHNRVFVRTVRGVVVLNQTTDKWIKIASNLSITDIVEYDDEVYLIFNNRIHYYDFEHDRIVKDPRFEDYEVRRFMLSNDAFFWFISANLQVIYCYDKNKELRRRIELEKRSISQIPYVFNQHLLIRRENGLAFYKVVENELILEPQVFLDRFGSAYITRILSIDEHTLAIATMGQGIFLYHVEEEKLEHIHSKDGVSSLNSDFVRNLFLDKDENLWVSTFDKGLNVDYNEVNKFNKSRALNLKTNESFVNCIVYNTYNDDLLFGTRMNGIISKDHHHCALNEKINAYDLGGVISLFEDDAHKLWIGGKNFLIVYDQVRDRVLEIDRYQDLQHIESISQFEDRIYVVSEEKGIFTYNLDGKRINHSARRISGINHLIHSPSSSYFCSIRSGLYTFNRKNFQTERLEITYDGKAFDWEGAVCMKMQDDTTLWLGTLSWGLIKVNINTLDCVNYTKNDGLPGNDVTGIEIDADGRLWLSTSDGLSCMFAEGQFSNFSAHEGVGNFQFHRRSSYQSDEGIMYFGGNNGLSYFHPSEISFNRVLEGHVVLEALRSKGEEIKCGDKTGILKQSLPYTKSLLLPYDYSSFSISYSLPQAFAHDQIIYAYKLDGWDKEWHESLGSQTIYYTNLPAGDYTFLVKASRRSSQWSQATSLDITLKSAPWFSWWAFVIYFIFVVSIISVMFVLTIHRKVAQASLLNEQNEHHRINEINEMKHRFFTNISHELRTPLTIIHAISNINAKELGSEESIFHFLRNLRLNTERLKRLVDQLLTFRNLERDTLGVDIKIQDITNVISRVVEPFELFTQQKKIKFSTHCKLKSCRCAIDRDKIEKILNNLLDNAIKYTSPGGSVELNVGELSFSEAISQGWDIAQEIDGKKDHYLLCQVSDNGIGIDPKALDRIFDRYYKATSNADYSGTGIGLNFVKRLVELQQGQIRAQSELGKGTQISFILPLVEADDVLDDAESVDFITSNEDTGEDTKAYDVVIPELYHGKTLLIVEDDISLNNFLHKTYEDAFKVYSAYNSHEGLIMAKNTYPDLIISDVMMGEVDEGLKFCSKIKQDSYISHIPVVLLTARTEKSQILEGYSYGADAYVTKPFDLQILTSHIVSLLENRARLQRDMFKNELPPKVKDEDYNQNDIVFIKKINEIIFEQYMNPEFNIASLSRDLFISRSAFYKKFTQVTKLSPNDYLRKYRIKKAVELMKDEQYSITQIVDMVGFNSRSGFYSSFKNEKGMTPSEFIKSTKNI